MFDVVLYQPEIPPNTGNVMRLCANAGPACTSSNPWASCSRIATCAGPVWTIGTGWTSASTRAWTRTWGRSSRRDYMPVAPGATSPIQARATRRGTPSCSAPRPAACHRTFWTPAPPAGASTCPCALTTAASTSQTPSRWWSSRRAPERLCRGRAPSRQSVKLDLAAVLEQGRCGRCDQADSS